jgi:hypothetical protein
MRFHFYGRRGIWWRVFGWLTTPRAAALLLGLLGVFIGYGGYLYHHCECQPWPNLVVGWEQEFEAFYPNLATTLVGMAIAVFTIDWLNERRADKQLKEQLIREMGHPADNGVALRAVRELRARGWLQDGSVRWADLFDANLQEADLEGADLEGANLGKADLEEANLKAANLKAANLKAANLKEVDLSKANLQAANLEGASINGANLRETNLRGVSPYWFNLLTVADLQGAIMPDGSLHE